MISVIYKNRALPIAWLVIKGKKGHFPEDIHIELTKRVAEMIPKGTDVVFVGDGEFDGTSLLKTISRFGWKYVCRTGINIVYYADGEKCEIGDLSDGMKPGEHRAVVSALFTGDKYGPVMIICQWGSGHKEPIYLVTDMNSATDACLYYKKRFKIETFFSDQKSRGFNLHKSHISNPERLSRLMIATCLAYIWIIYLGVLTIARGWDKIIHRTDRCDLSLFKLGKNCLDYILNENLKIPVAFKI